MFPRHFHGFLESFIVCTRLSFIITIVPITKDCVNCPMCYMQKSFVLLARKLELVRMELNTPSERECNDHISVISRFLFRSKGRWIRKNRRSILYIYVLRKRIELDFTHTHSPSLYLYIYFSFFRWFLRRVYVRKTTFSSSPHDDVHSNPSNWVIVGRLWFLFWFTLYSARITMTTLNTFHRVATVCCKKMTNSCCSLLAELYIWSLYIVPTYNTYIQYSCLTSCETKFNSTWTFQLP